MTTQPQAYEAGYYARDNARPKTDRPVFSLGDLGREQRAAWDRGWDKRDQEIRIEQAKGRK